MPDLTDTERSVRQAVRNFLLTATPAQLEAELALSVERGDRVRARFVRELIEESKS